MYAFCDLVSCSTESLTAVDMRTRRLFPGPLVLISAEFQQLPLAVVVLDQKTDGKKKAMSSKRKKTAKKERDKHAEMQNKELSTARLGRHQMKGKECCGA